MNPSVRMIGASVLVIALLAGCSPGNPASEVSETSVLPAPTAEEAAPIESSTNPEEAWKATAELLSPAGPSDYYVATNPADLARVSDYVVLANVGPPSQVRVFATAAQSGQPVYSTVGFPLTDVESLNSPYVDARRKLSGDVIAEVVAPVDFEGLDHPALLDLPAESRAILFANEFTNPGPDTSVTGTEDGTTYIAPSPQGFVIEAEGTLLFVQNESLASDFLTKDLGLTTLDEVIEWLNEGVEADRETASS